ncbi:putative drug exporter of the RND superfamily [Actinacidiphila yanglinensis]|uniref:Putative drug exporter of the RND superfamily n=1 Tax=Actinacidiphila yanglinensis TaxID=310779 RepID=A0A1H6E7G8_9ACTN|nr:MMPL family transporter [Actinacidiphila yanglinensis]SEG93660.1 putative drug exporter of the RND superfamily [Actinacidiphila yanglinensis]
MFHRIGRAVVRHPVWTIVAWLVAAIAIVATAPSLPSNSDESSFLPSSYQSIKALDLQEKAFPSAFTPSAIVLYQRTDNAPLTAADKADISRITTALGNKHIDQVQKVITGSESGDHKYKTALVQMDKKSDGQPKQADAAKALRADSADLAKGTQLKVLVGGQAAQNLDQQDAGNSSDAVALVGSLLIIIITLLIIFRSPLIAIMPLVILMGLVFTTSNGLISYATKLFGLQANSSISALLIVVVLGVGTDYFLFLMFRYRERLRLGDDPKEAMVNSVTRVGEAIASAAGAVIISFLALSLSTLGFLTQLGPALAILVAVTLIAGLTLFPAICSLIPPRALFWPGKKWGQEPTGTRFTSIGRMVGGKSGWVAIVSGLVMVLLALGTLGYKADYDLASGSIPKTKESMVVQDTMKKAFSAGAADPTSVFLTRTDHKPLTGVDFTAYKDKLAQADGVASATFDQKTGLSKDRTTALFNLTLKYSGASDKAISAVGDVRTTAKDNAPPGTEAVVGGTSSIYRDINAAVNHDYRTVFPVAAILIMVILGLLLRSIVAPWYLIASVALGFGATLGATVLIFGRGDGLIFLLPIIMYLFVVAIGTDYNILMIARLREEAREGREPREAAAEALRHAGPTIASAGFILAATFATLMLSGNSFLTEMGFAIAFGIVVAAFVMAMFFTPSLTALIGHAAWWPGHADRGAGPQGGVVAAGGGTDPYGAPELDESGRRR